MNRLHRSRRNRVILGVCGGLAEYFGIDPTIVRIISAVIAIPGPGLIMYILAALVMPEDNDNYSQGDQWNSANSRYTSSDNQWNQGVDADSGSDQNTNKDTNKDTSTSGFESNYDVGSDEWRDTANYESKQKSKVLLGLILVCLGIMFLVKQLFPMFDMKYIIPIAFIVIGFGIIAKGRGK